MSLASPVRLRRFQHVRGDLEVQVGVLDELEQRRRLRVRGTAVEGDETAVVEDDRLLGELREDPLEAREVLGEARDHHAEAERWRTPATARR